MTDRVKQLDIIQLEARSLFEKKNSDYGDAFATYGPIGVLFVLGIKFSVFNQLTRKALR